MLPQYTPSSDDIEGFLRKRTAIIGYGSQGSAQALNLRDSGADVVVGCRAGNSYDKAKADGFEVLSVADAVDSADVIAVMLPDESAAEIYAKDIEPNMHTHQTLLFAHGFNIHYDFIKPPKNSNNILPFPIKPQL